MLKKRYVCVCIIKVNFTCFLLFVLWLLDNLDAGVAHVTFCQAGLLQRTQAPRGLWSRGRAVQRTLHAGLTRHDRAGAGKAALLPASCPQNHIFQDKLGTAGFLLSRLPQAQGTEPWFIYMYNLGASFACKTGHPTSVS